MRFPFRQLHDLIDAQRNFEYSESHGVFDSTATGDPVLSGAFGQFLFSPGDVKLSAIPAAPSGWLLCDGTSYVRTAQPALFAAIGTTYGAVDGTHFSVPDLRGRVPLGAGTGSASGATAHALGSQPTSGVGGEEKHLLSTAEMPAHIHNPGDSGTFFVQAGGGSGGSANVTTGGGGYALGVSTSIAGSSAAHNILQPVSTVNYFIKT